MKTRKQNKATFSVKQGYNGWDLIKLIKGGSLHFGTFQTREQATAAAANLNG